MSEHITRMQDERVELEERIAKAQAFLDSPVAREQLNRMQVHLLNIQIDYMRGYLRVLKIRIEHDTEIANASAVES